MASNAATVTMAKVIKELGVPSGIIGKMVVTPPSEMVWLSPNDLRAMGANMIGKPSQTPNETRNEFQRPLQLDPSVQANTPQTKKAETTWGELVTAAFAKSSAQNGGKPVTSRSCQPELRVCITAVHFKNNKGKSALLKTTENLNGKAIKHEICEFNDFLDVRTCLNWDTAVSAQEMKNSSGQWIKVSTD